MNCAAPKVLESWNGYRYGEYVLQDRWKSGNRFPLPNPYVKPITPGALPLLKMSCNGQTNLLPNSFLNISAHVTFVRTVYDWVYKEMYSIVSCGADRRNLKMNPLIFNVLHALPSSWLYQLTTNVPNFHLDSFWRNIMNSWLLNKQSDPQTTYNRIVSLETCNFNSWTTKGICSLSFSGFADLFGIDIRLNAYVKNCTNEFPEIYVECYGADCSIFEKSKFCTSNNDCSRYTQCKSYRDMTMDVFKYYNYPYHDIIGEIIWNQTRTDNTCNNFDEFITDIKNYLTLWSYGGKPTDKICSFDMKHLLYVAQDWIGTQYERSGEDILLTKLTSWNV